MFSESEIKHNSIRPVENFLRRRNLCLKVIKHLMVITDLQISWSSIHNPCLQMHWNYISSISFLLFWSQFVRDLYMNKSFCLYNKHLSLEKASNILLGCQITQWSKPNNSREVWWALSKSYNNSSHLSLRKYLIKNCVALLLSITCDIPFGSLEIF